MRIANCHIGYCTNIYAGETAADIQNHIDRQCTVVKAAICPDTDMGIGLWMPAKAAQSFGTDPRALQARLAAKGLYAFTVNAFPFGDFHTRPVKENVYLPNWATDIRRDYTITVAQVLAGLLPAGVDGTISTVPVAYGKVCPPEAVENLLQAAIALEKLETATSRLVRLALEPEPDCVLECTDECIVFFDKLRRRAPELVDRYLGVCLDVCHLALQFEDPVIALQRLQQAGIAVPKIQVSAALEIENPAAADFKVLRAFNDGIYFHQTRIQTPDGVQRHADLPEALAARSPGIWRIHFHVPLHYRATQTRLHSTADLLDDRFFRQALISTAHLETETYSYTVLPDKYQDPNASVTDELKFLAQAVRTAVKGKN